ncbi:hypothetical protein RCL1_003442 [Eukaryota sp. TZLM3-RCL]
MSMTTSTSPHTQIRKLREKRSALHAVVQLMKLMRLHLPNYAQVCTTAVDFRTGVAALLLFNTATSAELPVNTKANSFVFIENWQTLTRALEKESVLDGKFTADWTSFVAGEPITAEMITYLYSFYDYLASKLQ